MVKVTARIRRGKKDLNRIVRQLRGPDKVKVGFPVGTESDILDRAVYNEFGTKNIPERPFMRNGLRDGVPELRRVSKGVSKRIIAGSLSKRQALDQLGIAGVNLVKESIVSLKDPANAASTIEAKGSDNPLIDSGEMLGAVTHEVE